MKSRLELRVRAVGGIGRRAPEVVVSLAIVPRGSGNRYKARRLADAFASDERMKRHLKRVVCGASRVTLHLRPSLALMEDINAICSEAKSSRDVRGQLVMFGR